jgi:uncharacterized protein YbaR (Trm112 family)
MHLLLTDRLTCPRCGPHFSLVLMADDLADRRVREGKLGCFNCREEYPVRKGVGDLRPPPRDPPPSPEGSPEDDAEGALRLAAFLGVKEGPGHLLLVGECAAHAERLAAMIEEIEVVAVHPGLEGREEIEGVSRIRMGPRIPLQQYATRGVALEGDAVGIYLDEALRVLGPQGRIVLFGADPDPSVRLEEAGLEVLLRTERVLVAGRG